MVEPEIIDYWREMDAEELKKQIEYEGRYLKEYSLEENVLRAEIALKSHNLERNRANQNESREELEVMYDILEEKEEA